MTSDPPGSGAVALAAVLVLGLLAAGALSRARGAFGDALDAPRRAGAAPTRAGRPLVPVLAPDARRLVADVVRPGRRPRLVTLRPGAGLPDLLGAAGLSLHTPVAGAPASDPRLVSGMRLVVHGRGRARLGCMPAERRLRLGLPLDANADRATDLERLPGVGPVLAARIVRDRARYGPYASVSALTRVQGVGPRTVARMAPFVSADTATRCAGGQE